MITSEKELLNLPYKEYMEACRAHAEESGFFALFPKAEDKMFAQLLWARRYWLYINKDYDL